ncbi:Ig-like domain-containing protein [Halanaerobacter jeridensis]|uniref:SipL SPOCS domain-containing protein n=1 Tax=Halanaerobacter jeridensis TaxID=706427 RepID=A0A938XRV0_9FIRM|nr:Ig-like domain-containing protein [Halanaerobacter jeridensis]MBM7556619.1 hypothetical protein [Halanaerobacter jeridensis]
MAIIGGIDLGELVNYLFFFADANQDANWQGASKGFVGDVAVDGLQADERTAGTVPYAGIISTNDTTLDAWQDIIDDNPLQSASALNELALISNLEADLISAFLQINALAATPGFENRSSGSLDGLDTTGGGANVTVINVTSGFTVSSPITITGDASDVFILRWDTDADPTNGYQGQVKFQSGGAIIPAGGLEPGNFIHVAGDINSSGGGSTPAPPYPQGPRFDDGQGALINGGSDFSGGGFFTGYWLTTGEPDTPFPPETDLIQGETQSLSNGIFVGGWYTITTAFSMTSGTSGVYVSPNPATIVGTPPVVDKTPSSGTIVNEITQINVTASDAECLDRVELYINEVLVQTVVDNGPGDLDPDPNEINFVFNWDTTAETDGLNLVLARAIDCDDNQSNDLNQYIVDNTPPIVDKTPPSGSFVTGITPIEVTASDAECLDRVELYIDGNLVETVEDNGPGDNDPAPNEINFTFDWDTTVETDGDHIVIARAIDCTGNQTDDRNEYIVDNTPPIVDKTPPAGSIVSGLTPIEVTASDDICLDRVELLIDGSIVETVEDNGPGDDDPDLNQINFTFNWDTTAETEGDHTVIARAIDCVRQETEDENIYTVDNTPPVVDIVDPPDGSLVSGITEIDVTGSDNECLDRVELYIDGNLVFTQSVAPGTNTAFTFDWDTIVIADGLYNIRAVAIDCAGNEAVDQIQLIVDNTPPDVDKTPPSGSLVTGITPIEVTASDNICLDRVELYIDGDLVETVADNGPGDNDPDPNEIKFIFDWDTTAVADGEHVIIARAIDCVGNQTDDQNIYRVDNTPPVVDIIDPPDGSTVEGVTPIEVTGSDNECLDRVELYIDGELVATESVAPGMETTFFFDWDTTQYLEGPHEVTAIAIDCVGNTADTTNIYIVDNIPDNFVEELVDGNLTLPEQKPDIEQIIDFNVAIKIDELFTIDAIQETKIKVKGRIKITISYVADVEDNSQPVNSAHFTIPFKSLITGLPVDACVSLDPVVILEHVQHHLIDSRTIKKAIVFLIGVRES